MKKLIIEKIQGYNYFLKDSQNMIYHLNISFYDLPKNPQVNDYLFIHEQILMEENKVLNFGLLSSDFGKKIELLDDSEVAVLLIDDEKIYLKRHYG